MKETDKHYDKRIAGEKVDVYRICRMYDITDPSIFHAIKKLLRSGQGPKSKEQDVQGSILCLQRWLELEEQARKEQDGSELSSAKSQ